MTIDKKVLLAYGRVKQELTRGEFPEGPSWSRALGS